MAAQAGADLADVHRRVVTEALPAARDALDAPEVPAQVHLVVAGGRRAAPAKRVVD